MCVCVCVCVWGGGGGGGCSTLCDVIIMYIQTCIHMTLLGYWEGHMQECYGKSMVVHRCMSFTDKWQVIEYSG